MRSFLYQLWKVHLPLALCIVALVLCVVYISISPPKDFPSKTIISVEEGSGLYELANKLEKENVIRSPFWFRAAAIIMGGERDMKAGQYYVAEPETSFLLAWRVLHGDYKLKAYKVTIPEGFTVKKISGLFDERFPFFDNQVFESLAEEGYLFPDTYFMQESVTASSTIKLLKGNFTKKTLPLLPELESSGKTLKEIITMASIIEGEAKTDEDRQIVSSILWKRLKLGLPLQVDATFVYLLGKKTSELTQDDLKVDSPYNTYLYPGLPPTPISNPGIESIEAALRPTTTPYLYFLTANDGTMHYSKTFEEHVAAKQKYLNTR